MQKDTAEFSFRGEDALAISITRKVAKVLSGQRLRPLIHTVCGILKHSSLVMTPTSLSVGLAGIRLWTRKKFNGTNALKGLAINPGKLSLCWPR